MSKKLNRIESFHYGIEDQSSQILPSSMQENELPLDHSLCMFDVLKSKMSLNVHTVTSQHLVIGQHCVDMIRGNQCDPSQSPEIIHHTAKIKTTTALVGKPGGRSR